MKTCTKCGETKPTDDFAKLGKDSRCKSCVAAYMREWTRNHAELNQQRVKEWRAKNSKAKLAADREYRKRHPQKYKAHMIVGEAKKRGDLVPQPCAKCGHEPTQAHHHDYSKPLDVIWLCHRCHTAEHHKHLEAV